MRNQAVSMGMRVFEQLRLEWLDYYEKIPPRSSVNVYAEPSVMDTINQIGIGYGALLGYYEEIGLIERKLFDSPIDINGVVITCVNVSKTKPVSVFVFEGNGKMLIRFATENDLNGVECAGDQGITGL